MTTNGQPSAAARSREREETVQVRSSLARWLSAVFSGALDPAREELPLPDGSTRLARCARRVHELIPPGTAVAGDGKRRAGLESERVRLLVNAPGGVAAPPYGSWWTEGCLQGRTTAEVADFYRGEGLEPQPGSGPADFLGAELEFLHFLLQHQHAAAVTRQPELEGHSRRRERAFLEAHVLTWIPGFCAAGREATRDPVWLALFDLLQFFVEDEARRVGDAD
jgi:TorA maturation chaperone TorD